jgi:hypothetical protein
MIKFKDFIFGQIDEKLRPITQAQLKNPKKKAISDRRIEVIQKLASMYNENPRRFKSYKAGRRLAAMLGIHGIDTSSGLGRVTDQLHMISHEGDNAFSHPKSEIIGQRTVPVFAKNPDYLAKTSSQDLDKLRKRARQEIRNKKLRQGKSFRY